MFVARLPLSHPPKCFFKAFASLSVWSGIFGWWLCPIIVLSPLHAICESLFNNSLHIWVIYSLAMIHFCLHHTLNQFSPVPVIYFKHAPQKVMFIYHNKQTWYRAIALLRCLENTRSSFSCMSAKVILIIVIYKVKVRQTAKRFTLGNRCSD